MGVSAEHSGIMKKWADKYGIKVDIVQINDYVESINQYTAGAYDGCAMTNMDALSIPAAGGVDTTALIVGDYSNGNDGIVLKGKTSSPTSRGRRSIWSSYRSRTTCWRGRSRPSACRKRTSPSSTLPTPIWSPPIRRRRHRLVTWNPLLSEVSAAPKSHQGVQLLLDSRRNHRPHDGEHRDAEGQPGFRQGAGGRVV